MATRFVVQSADGQISCSVERDGRLKTIGTPRPFASPLSQSDLGDLAWYYDTYPLTATGHGHFRASLVEARLPKWGRLLFDVLFPPDSIARKTWDEAADADRSVWLAGGGDGFLSLPWEIARSSDVERPLGLWARLTRCPVVPKMHDRVELPALSRALLVISRPEGTPSISFNLFARELLAQLGEEGAGLEVEVLRPPTFEAFQARLQAARDAGRPYDLIHFDGHGTIGPSKNGARVAYLTFESSAGAPRHIDSEALGKAFGNAGVPLVVLAACHSGDVAGAEGSVATTLIRSGAARAVVAMSHAVCTDAAQAFLGEFYRGVVAGQSLSQAVCVGRSRLADSPVRIREHGEVRLEDWAVPVLYSEAPIAFATEATRLAERRVSHVLGRDTAYFELERLLRRTRSVGITGLAGVGKTTFARDAAHWLSVTTAGHTATVCVDAAGIEGLEALTKRIGDALGCAESSLGEILGHSTGPIVLDGVELAGWHEDDKKALIAALCGRSGDAAPVIVTARGSSLVDAGLTSIVLPPLPREVIRNLLPDGLRNDAVAEQFIDGHAAMAVAATPARSGDLFPISFTAGGLTQVRAVLEGLPSQTIRQLRLIAGHGPRLEFQSLKHLTNYFARDGGGIERADDIKRVERGTYESWNSLVETCIGVGLAERVEGDIYRLHPGLGPALVETWREESGDSFKVHWAALQDTVDQAILATASQLSMFMAMGAGFGNGNLPGPMRMLDTRYIRSQLTVLEPRIRVAVIRALDDGRAEVAELAGQALGMLWNETGRRDVAFCEAIVERISGRPSEHTSGGSLLLWTALQQIALQPGPSSVDVEAMIRAMLDQPEEPQARISRGEWLLLLAITLDVRGRATEAEPLAQQALEVFRHGDNPDAVRRAKHALVTIRGNLGRRGAAVWQTDSDETGMAPIDYIEAAHQKAIRAFDEGNVQDAMQLQLGNLEAADANPRQRAKAMHELGLLCLKLGRDREAENWFLQSLAIKETMYQPGDAVRTLLMLAMVALGGNRLDEAAGWFKKVLAVSDKANDTMGPSAWLGLAEIARRRGDTSSALDHVVTALARFVHTGLPENSIQLREAQSVLAEATASELEAAWQRVQGQNLQPEERVGLAECLVRVGLNRFAEELSEPVRDATDATVAARALLLHATAISERLAEAGGQCSDEGAGLILDDAIRKLRTAEPLPRPITKTLGMALFARAGFHCGAGNKIAGVAVAQEAVKVMEIFREGPEVEYLMDYARAQGLLGMACRDLGRWEEAARAHVAEADAYRICSTANAGFRPRRFNALHVAAMAHLQADAPKAALDVCTMLRVEMSQLYPGSSACTADPPLGLVVELIFHSLSRLGDEEGARRVITDRWSELDGLVREKAPGVFLEFANWTLWLLTRAGQPEFRLMTRLAEAASSASVDEFTPAHANSLAKIAWENLQCYQPDMAQVIQAMLASLYSRAPERVDLRVALARVDFSTTLSRGIQTSPRHDEELAERLKDGILAADDPTSSLNDPLCFLQTVMQYGFATQYAVSKRLRSGEIAAAADLTDAFEALILPRPEALAHSLPSLVGCRRNLIVARLTAHDVQGAIAELRRVLALAVETGGTVKFGEVEHDAAGSDDVSSSPGLAMMDAAKVAMAHLVEDGAQTTAKAMAILHELTEAAVEHPGNDLVGSLVLAACSNLLLRTAVSAEDAKVLQERISATVAARAEPGLISRALPVIYVGRVYAERQRNDLQAAEACLDELIATTDGAQTGQMIAYAGLGLARDLAERQVKSAFVAVIRKILDAVRSCKELESFLEEMSGATGYALTLSRELDDEEGVYRIIESLRGLLPLYPNTSALCHLLGVEITNYISRVRSPETLKAWARDLQTVCNGPAFPQQAEVRVAGTANALFALDAAGLGLWADEIGLKG